jgi:hypothetical protein
MVAEQKLWFELCSSLVSNFSKYDLGNVFSKAVAVPELIHSAI